MTEQKIRKGDVLKRRLIVKLIGALSLSRGFRRLGVSGNQNK